MTQATTAPAPPRSRRKWVLIGIVTLLLVCSGCVLIFLFSSSPLNKYIVALGLPAPDRAFQTGTIYGYNVYVWDCYANKHIVVYHYTSEMTSQPFSRQESACGATTPIEDELAAERKRELNPDRFW